LFNLSKDTDVRPFVVRKKIDGKKRAKAPKIQRLITSTRIQRKKRYLKSVEERQANSRAALEEYKEMMARYKEKKTEKPSAEAAL
jgi:small subunit ribosomal protein S6e